MLFINDLKIRVWYAFWLSINETQPSKFIGKNCNLISLNFFKFFLVPSSRRVLSRLIKFIASIKFSSYSIVYVVLMVFMLNFKGPYHNIRMRLGNVLVVRDLYGLPLHSDHFSV